VKVPLLAAVAALLVSLPARATAVNLDISPVVLELGAKVPSAVVTVRNGGASPTRYQVYAHAWTEGPDGPKLVPSQELSVFPPLFTLEAKAERKLRVGPTVPPGTVERAWRLFVEELPSATDRKPGSRIEIRTRFALPVFQEPIRPQPAATVALAFAGGKLRAVVRNGGNVHLRPAVITVGLAGANGEKLQDVDVPPAFVLAGAERVSDVAVPAQLCGKIRSASIVAELPSEKLQGALALPGGACAP
jgi:fimbrial chaperone protein